LPISRPTRNRLPRSIDRGAVAEALLGDPANRRIDHWVAGAAIDEALEYLSRRIDPETKEDLGSTGP
jgi:hypothetical protein